MFHLDGYGTSLRQKLCYTIYKVAAIISNVISH